MRRNEPSTVTAANVRAELARRNKTGRDLAKALNWSASTTARRLAGDSAFTVEQLVATAAYLEVPIADLIAVSAETAA